MPSIATLRADRVQETTNTTGVGTLTLVGAVTSYQPFTSAFTTGDLVEYTILSGNNWEIGIGTFTTAGNLLSRDIILRSSNAGAAITVAAGALVWSNLGADTFQSSVQPFRNRLINASWRHDQVNEGTAYTVTGGAGTIQAVDGWSGVGVGAGTFTMQRVADPDNASLYALKIACTVADASIAAGDAYLVETAIEGYDVADLKTGTASAAQITISMDVKFDVTGVYGVSLLNSASNRSYVGLFTQNVASANERKMITLTLDTAGTWLYTNGVGMYLRIGLAVGSTFQTASGAWTAGNFVTTSAQCNFMSANTNVGYVKRVQLEKGSVATPFEEISMYADFARVKRYFRKSYSQGTAVGTVTRSGRIVQGLFATAAAGIVTPIHLDGMRAVPTVTPYSTETGASGKWVDGAGTDQTATVTNAGTEGAEISISAGDLRASFGHYTANARLI